MSKAPLPFSKEFLENIIKTYPTPFHIYDEKAIVENANKFKQAFSWVDGFKNFFAVKALPNPHVIKLLTDEEFGTDCSSLAELVISEKIGVVGEKIMFTSNDTPKEDYVKAIELGAIINFDDITHIDYFLENFGKLCEPVSFRYNPGHLRGGNSIIGHPEEAKYGFTRNQLFEGYKKCKKHGVKRFGLHTMIASNELDANYFVETAKMLFELVAEISTTLEIEFEFVNLGGGIGIPYKPEQKQVDYNQISEGVKRLYTDIIVDKGFRPLKIFMENGRVITGPYGYLVARAIHEKHTYKEYIGLDACMANLMRPGLYGAYHHITVLGKEKEVASNKYDIVGSLCENNDKFAIDRLLPKIEIGDLFVIHDTGAHGHAMGFNYNGKLRSAELLLRTDGSVKLIRRAETVDDYLTTLDFSSL